MLAGETVKQPVSTARHRSLCTGAKGITSFPTHSVTSETDLFSGEHVRHETRELALRRAADPLRSRSKDAEDCATRGLSKSTWDILGWCERNATSRFLQRATDWIWSSARFLKFRQQIPTEPVLTKPSPLHTGRYTTGAVASTRKKHAALDCSTGNVRLP